MKTAQHGIIDYLLWVSWNVEIFSKHWQEEKNLLQVKGHEQSTGLPLEVQKNNNIIEWKDSTKSFAALEGIASLGVTDILEMTSRVECKLM